MIKYFLKISILCFLFSCTSDKKPDYDFIIKKVNQKDHITFYGQHNFILVDSNKVYYHNKYVYHWCGTGLDYTKPSKLYLYPDSLKEIHLNQLKDFLSSLENKPPYFSKFSFASISSPSDTVRHNAYPLLIDYFKSKKKLKYVVRKWTEEEEIVSIAKKEHKFYNPDKIIWKVGFDKDSNYPPNVVEFLPPTVEK